MGRALVLIGSAEGSAPGPASAEEAAFEYFYSRALMGNWTPRPPIHRWAKDQRERYLAELKRLEAAYTPPAR